MRLDALPLSIAIRIGPVTTWYTFFVGIATTKFGVSTLTLTVVMSHSDHHVSGLPILIDPVYPHLDVINLPRSTSAELVGKVMYWCGTHVK